MKILKELIERKRRKKEQRIEEKRKEKELNEIQYKKIPANVLTWATFKNPNIKKEDKLFGDFDDFIILIQALEYPEQPELPIHMQGDNFFVPNTLKKFSLNGDFLGGTAGKLTKETIENLKEANLFKDYYEDCEVKIIKLEIKACIDIGNNDCYISLLGQNYYKLKYKDLLYRHERLVAENLSKDLLTNLEVYGSRAIISIRDIDNIRKHFYNFYTQERKKENEFKSKIENRDKQYKEAQYFVDSLRNE